MNHSPLHSQWKLTFTIAQCLRIDLQSHTILLGYKGEPLSENLTESGQNFTDWLSTSPYKNLHGAGILLPIELALQDRWYATRLEKISIISNELPRSELRSIGQNKLRTETFATGHIRELRSAQLIALDCPIVVVSCNLGDAALNSTPSLTCE